MGLEENYREVVLIFKMLALQSFLCHIFVLLFLTGDPAGWDTRTHVVLSAPHVSLEDMLEGDRRDDQPG